LLGFLEVYLLVGVLMVGLEDTFKVELIN